MIIYLLIFLLILSVAIVLFLNLNPAFGGSITKEQEKAYSKFDNYADGKFVNTVPTKLFMGSSNSSEDTSSSKEEPTDSRPATEIPIEPIDWNKINSEKDSLTWLGHSTFLISIDNKKILLDPMLGPIASPVSFVGVKRYKYSKDMMNIINDMPNIDAVFISHDHYDHLDYQSILKLKSKVSHFFVPLGVSAHLISWGVPKDKIIELNWWEEKSYEGLTLALTPSRHFSGRGILNLNTTLWGGLALIGKDTRLYYSGDGGYGPHFKEIGNKYGPFDIALIEGAQYDRRWANTHMMPEQSVQANLDVNGKNMILMHWGAFTLARHDWKEPIQRALKETKKADVNLIVPRIGETVILGPDIQITDSSWWDF
ncbi:MBL fold metallo-hydrolase [Clostridium sp. CS001]|uniref:MBL fold metallo-hydrolase n=1 Tax=Clostridium sp. CS001 TaxID=2880648 RepID=UPI001CF5F097|nr:MBL fold metallo-hydrolase [Clostridium sp. CS001]MCB2288496.1 MBL fold metallo-hydrolase [Clostridium sp. CS001]